VKVLEAGDWSLLLPDEWEADRDEDSVFIGDRDGVGSLEITALRKAEGSFGTGDMREFLDPALQWEAVQCGSFAGKRSALMEDGEALREWCLHTDGLLLYVTYSCDLANRGLDDAAVDEILDTLRYAQEE